MRLFGLLFLICFPLGISAFDGEIVVDFSEVRLILQEQGSEIASFPVGLPIKKPKFPVTGKVIKVEKNPFWRPTQGTRKAYFKKHGYELPELLRPGEKENAMGKGKISIAFNEVWVDSTVKIHGTNDESSIGGRVSRGCIRMKNEDVLRLIELIREKDIYITFTE